MENLVMSRLKTIQCSVKIQLTSFHERSTIVHCENFYRRKGWIPIESRANGIQIGQDSTLIFAQYKELKLLGYLRNISICLGVPPKIVQCGTEIDGKQVRYYLLIGKH